MNKSNPLTKLCLTNPVHFFAVGLGSGLLRPAPGTWGTLLGLFIGAGVFSLVGIKTFAILTALGFILGCYLCQKTADDMGVHDHGAIVWDEFIGIWICLLALPEISLKWCAIAFAAFRFFDILKPYPIKTLDQKLENGFGIMIDDVLAAVYALVLIIIFREVL